MAVYAVGDVHGNYEKLRRLSELAGWDESDQVVFVGDLLGRGEESLEVLRWAHEHRSRVALVLGNHEVDLLVASAGLKVPADSAVRRVLEAPDAEMLCSWLRRQPLMRRAGEALVVHAGLLPEWSAAYALRLAEEVSAVIAGNRAAQMRAIYGNRACRANRRAGTCYRWQLAVNAMTRMRMIDGDGGFDPTCSGPPSELHSLSAPWFVAPGRLTAGRLVICGHWSTLGLTLKRNLAMLDAGCGRGGPLAALRLEDRRLHLA